MTKRQIEVEKLLQWAYRDELSKRVTSSAEGIWDQIIEYGQHGGINHDPGHGAAQRYSHFGLPHPDADTIEKAVSALPDGQVDWNLESEAIMGDLLGIVDTRPLSARPPAPRQTLVGWWEGSRWYKMQTRARDVIMVRSLKSAALVTMHAKMGTRPDWQDDAPRPYQTRAARGSKAAIVGECWGKAAYSPGSHCPLTWDPSPISVAETRADYLAWWRGLNLLAKTLVLQDFDVLPPTAPEMPWVEPEPIRAVHVGVPIRHAPLPLTPQRDRAGPVPVRPKGGPVRTIAITGA